MKRTLLLVLTIILIMSSLTGCIIIPKYKNFEIVADTVLSVEIYDTSTNRSPYEEFFATAEPAYRIPKDNVADFLYDLGNIRFSDIIIITLAAVDPSFHYDTWTVRLNYTDGSYEFISCDGYGESFDKDGNCTDYHHYGCDNDEWTAFIQKYVPEDVFKRPYETTEAATESQQN